jgi:DNA-binding GntR family transcriptional regulator
MDEVSYSPKRRQVLDSIRSAISSGQLRPGDRIVEQQLAKELGVSQTPVREALASLEREGMVVKVDHTGTFVSKIDPQDLVEILTLRAVLEGYCAALVSSRLDKSTLKPLESLVDEMSDAAEAGNLGRTTLLDARFHETLHQLSSHNLLRDTLGRLQQRIMLSVVYVDILQETDLRGIANNHVPLLRAIASGQPDVAEREARHHVLEILELAPIERLRTLDLTEAQAAVILSVLDASYDDSGGLESKGAAATPGVLSGS